MTTILFFFWNGFGDVTAAAASFGRLEYTVPLSLLQYTVPFGLLQYTVPDELLEYTAGEP